MDLVAGNDVIRPVLHCNTFIDTVFTKLRFKAEVK